MFKIRDIWAILAKVDKGESVADICAEHHITKDRLDGWRSKFRRSDNPQSAASPNRDRFIDPQASKKKNIHAFYKENLQHFAHHSSDGYDD